MLTAVSARILCVMSFLQVLVTRSDCCVVVVLKRVNKYSIQGRVMVAAKACSPPVGSAVYGLLPGASFFDAWQIQTAEPHLSALGQFLKAIEATPPWVNACMALRNKVVEKMGLKNLGALGGFDPTKPEAAYRAGDRVGIFTLFENTFDEVLLGDRDKHLDVTLSVHRQKLPDAQVRITITTVVNQHNRTS
jgi:hypothetical protein